MHKHPDGDALGASLALARLWKKYHHNVQIISPTRFPSFFKWMPNISDIVIHELEEAQANTYLSEATILCCVDFSTLGRVGEKMLIPFSKACKKTTVVMIDHHTTKEAFASITIWDPNSPAASMLIYEFIKFFDHQALDLATAICLYVGLLTDTGFFQTSNTTPAVHLAVNDLLTQGVIPVQVHNAIYNNQSLERMRFLGHALNKRLVILNKLNSAYIAIPKSDFRNFNLKAGDTEGLVNYPLRLKGVTCAILLTEQPDNRIKLSFRSTGELSVNNIAKSFGGGGHKNAAGGLSYSPLKETIKQLCKILEKS